MRLRLLLSTNSACPNPPSMPLPLLPVASSRLLPGRLQLAYLWLEGKPAQSLIQHSGFSDKKPSSRSPLQVNSSKDGGQGCGESAPSTARGPWELLLSRAAAPSAVPAAPPRPGDPGGLSHLSLLRFLSSLTKAITAILYM